MRVRPLLSLTAALGVLLAVGACEGENMFEGYGFDNGAQSGAIEGTVASTGGPLGGVTVVVVDRDSTLTDGAGFYRFADLPASTYTLTLRMPLNHSLAPGDSASRRVQVSAGGTERVDWNLVADGAAP